MNASQSVYNPLALEEQESASLELHPDRQAMLDKPQRVSSESIRTDQNQRQQRTHRTKAQPFKKETQLAQQRREEREARQREAEESNRQRQEKMDERERYRKVMAKARGKDGQRKLGRESKVLLEKVQRIMGG